MRRGIGGFQAGAEDDRPIVDHNGFKKDIGTDDQKIKSPQQQEGSVFLFQAFSPD